MMGGGAARAKKPFVGPRVSGFLVLSAIVLLSCAGCAESTPQFGSKHEISNEDLKYLVQSFLSEESLEDSIDSDPKNPGYVNPCASKKPVDAERYEDGFVSKFKERHPYRQDLGGSMFGCQDIKLENIDGSMYLEFRDKLEIQIPRADDASPWTEKRKWSKPPPAKGGETHALKITFSLHGWEFVQKPIKSSLATWGDKLKGLIPTLGGEKTFVALQIALRSIAEKYNGSYNGQVYQNTKTVFHLVSLEIVQGGLAQVAAFLNPEPILRPIVEKKLKCLIERKMTMNSPIFGTVASHHKESYGMLLMNIQAQGERKKVESEYLQVKSRIKIGLSAPTKPLTHAFLEEHKRFLDRKAADMHASVKPPKPPKQARNKHDLVALNAKKLRKGFDNAIHELTHEVGFTTSRSVDAIVDFVQKAAFSDPDSDSHLALSPNIEVEGLSAKVGWTSMKYKVVAAKVPISFNLLNQPGKFKEHLMTDINQSRLELDTHMDCSATLKANFKNGYFQFNLPSLYHFLAKRTKAKKAIKMIKSLFGYFVERKANFTLFAAPFEILDRKFDVSLPSGPAQVKGGMVSDMHRTQVSLEGKFKGPLNIGHFLE